MNSRKERREVGRDIAKHAGNVIASHEQRISALDAAFSIVIEVLKEEGVLTDEKMEKAKNRLLAKSSVKD